MIYIILSILGIFSTLLIKSKWSWRRQVTFVLCTLLVGTFMYLTVFFILGKSDIIEKGHSSFFSKIPWLEIGLYFSMIAGMSAKYFYDAIETTKRQKIVIEKWQLLKPLFISPIVFGTVYATIDRMSSSVLLIVFAFQNGFFWQAVLRKRDE